VAPRPKIAAPAQSTIGAGIRPVRCLACILRYIKGPAGEILPRVSLFLRNREDFDSWLWFSQNSK